jgi:hypothetical protein
MDMKYAKKIETKIWFNDIRKCEHEMKWIRWWFKIIFQNSVNKFNIWGVLDLFILLWGPTLKSFHGAFHMFILQGCFLKTFLIIY